MKWGDVKILDTATDLQERKIEEAVYIRLAPKWLKMNKDKGKEHSPLDQDHHESSDKASLPTSYTPRENQGQEITGYGLLPRHRLHDNQLEGPPTAVRRPTPSLRRSR